MLHQSLTRTCIIDGKEVVWSASPHWPTGTNEQGYSINYNYALTIDRRHAGYIKRDKDGVWVNPDEPRWHPKDWVPPIWFPLYSEDYQAIGEVIEREWPELFE